jgi:hypothetical protein
MRFCWLAAALCDIRSVAGHTTIGRNTATTRARRERRSWRRSVLRRAVTALSGTILG